VFTPRAAYPALPLDAFLERDFSALLLAAPPRHRPEHSFVALPEKPAGTERKTQLIVFNISGQDYALPASDVLEIMAVPAAITAVPGTGPEMLGVAERRGTLLPLVSLRWLLRLPPAAARDDHARVVVTQIGTNAVGLIVERIRPMVRAPAKTIGEVPPVLTRGRGEARIAALCRCGDGRLLPILAPNMLFEPETIARILATGTAPHFSDTTGTATEGTAADMIESFVGFRLGNEDYGIQAACVDQVVRCPPAITKVPHAPDFLRGLINLQGRTVPVIDQRARFCARAAGAPPGILLVLAVAGRPAAFCIDGFARMLQVPRRQLSPAPALSSGGGAVIDRIACIEREGRMIILIDAAALLDDAARDLVISLGATADSCK
jgi:purine-binding chemotaxis protein CheW